MRRVAAAAAVLALALAACGHGARHAPSGESARLAGGVVARVGGTAITAAEVAAEVRSGGGTPREALERLVRARLFAREALRRGYASRTDVEDAVARLSVQELLARDVEAAVPPASITDAELDAEYHRSFSRFHTPERREATHIVLTPITGAPPEKWEEARVAAQQALEELATSPDTDAVLASWQTRERDLGMAVRTEQLPYAAHDGTFVPAFEDALFAIDASHLPNVAPEPVRTRFGWHAILLRGVDPERTTPLADVAPRLRAELVVRRRHERVESMLGAIAARTPVRVDPASVEAMLAEAH